MDILEGKIHDYRQTKAKGVVLVVRKNNKYGAALPGERIRVDEKEATTSTMQSTCMPEKEYRQLLIEREKRVQETPPPSPVKAMVDRDLAEIEAQAEIKRNHDAKRKKLEAQAAAAEALAEKAPPTLDPSLPERDPDKR